MLKKNSHFFLAWIQSRIPVESEVTFGQRRIYILPTFTGGAFLIIVAVILLLAINYQSNLAYGVAFFLFSLLVTSIFHTYANLSGLCIQQEKSEPVFVGEQVAFRYRLLSAKNKYQLGFSTDFQESPRVDLVANQAKVLTLYETALRRGWQAPTWVKVSSVNPLGLFKVWGWFKLSRQALVYPKPIAGGTLPGIEDVNTDLASVGRKPSDELDGLSAYTPGANRHRIAWNTFAKGQGLYVKAFAQTQASQSVWLDVDYWPQTTLEERLSRLADWALLLNHEQTAFGLKASSISIQPDCGAAHLAKVLKTLALYGIDDERS